MTKNQDNPVKAIELRLIDVRTEHVFQAVYDASMITGVQEIREGGHMKAQIIVAGFNAINVDEDFHSLRDRWLAARGQEAIPSPEKEPASPRLVRPS